MNPTQRAWSPEDEQKLRELYPCSRTVALIPVFGRTAKAITSRAKVLQLRKRFDVPGLGAKRPWSFEEDFHLRCFYPHIPTAVLAARLGRPLHTIYRRAVWNLGLHKTKIYLDSPAACRLRREASPRSIACRFRKGQIPPNKGLRRPGWFRGRMRETQFKKGQRTGAANSNYKPVWTFVWNSDGYMLLKTREGRPKKPGESQLAAQGWEFVHRLVWEQAHGPIPPGYRIWWKDGDHANNSLANLELLSGADHVARTTIQNFPPELRQVMLLRGAINRAITMRTRKNEEQDRRSAQPPVRDPGSPQGQREAHGS